MEGKRLSLLAFFSLWITLVNIGGSFAARQPREPYHPHHCQWISYTNGMSQAPPSARTSNSANNLPDCKTACVGEPGCVAIEFQTVKSQCTLLNQHPGDVYYNVNYNTYGFLCKAGLNPGAPDATGWTIIQQRLDTTFNFDRLWADYKAGFGDPSVNYWMSLDEISSITNGGGSYAARFDLYLTSLNAWYSAQYESFSVDPESNKYTIHVTGYVPGSTGDVLNDEGSKWVIDGMPFSTPDNDNSKQSCASTYRGGWWFDSCYAIDLNSPFDFTNNGLGYSGFDCLINGTEYFIGQSRILIQQQSVLSITADNIVGELYFDGTSYPVDTLTNVVNWEVADSVLFPSATKLIAVLVINIDGWTGLLASTDSFVTDSTWKASNYYTNGWMESEFDDSGWANAYDYAQNGDDNPWSFVQGINPSADWIGTPEGEYGNEYGNITYYRYHTSVEIIA